MRSGPRKHYCCEKEGKGCARLRSKRLELRQLGNEACFNFLFDCSRLWLQRWPCQLGQALKLRLADWCLCVGHTSKSFYLFSPVQWLIHERQHPPGRPQVLEIQQHSLLKTRRGWSDKKKAYCCKEEKKASRQLNPESHKFADYTHWPCSTIAGMLLLLGRLWHVQVVNRTERVPLGRLRWRLWTVSIRAFILDQWTACKRGHNPSWLRAYCLESEQRRSIPKGKAST